jgi:hypothetical protein
VDGSRARFAGSSLCHDVQLFIMLILGLSTLVSRMKVGATGQGMMAKSTKSRNWRVPKEARILATRFG